MCTIYKKQRENTKIKKTKTKKPAKKESRYIYQNELDKAAFQHDVAYGDFKDLTKRTAFDKILHDKAFIIAKNRMEINMMDINVELIQWFIDFLIKNLQVEQLKRKIFLIKN